MVDNFEHSHQNQAPSEKVEKPLARLRNLQAKWALRGLILEVSYDSEDNTLEIEQFYYAQEGKKSNLGVTALQELIQIADEGQYKITLYPTPLDSTLGTTGNMDEETAEFRRRKERLEGFYRYFGFDYLGDSHTTMCRLPKTR